MSIEATNVETNSSIHESIHGSILGTRVVRTEDPALLEGRGVYVADLPLANRLHAVFVRSDIAHGTIRAIHLDGARGLPGVVAIWTAAELGVAPHQGFATVHADFARPPLADDRVRFVGEPYAVVSPNHWLRARTQPARCGPRSTRSMRSSTRNAPSTTGRR